MSAREQALDFKKMGKGVEIAESQRETTRHSGFMSSIFRGHPDFNLIFPWPERSLADKEKEQKLIDILFNFFKDVEPAIVNGGKDIPRSLIEQMSDLGLFRLKLPEEWGGWGLSQISYTNVIGYLATHCPAIAIVVSADNTIGAKFPVLNFGTEEQKKKYLSQLAVWPSAFCFTEKEVGSDPARMRTCAERIRDANGRIVGYRIIGEKWYATNSVLNGKEPLAEYLAVVAKIVDQPKDLDDENCKSCFGLFIVSTAALGFSIVQRTTFLGMHGIFNGVLRFHQVAVGADDLIGGEGMGFKIALQALNTGRIAIGGSCTAAAKQALSILNWWGKERKQWGRPIGEWELIGSGMLAMGAANTFAMEAVTAYAAARTSLRLDSRLEAAVAKVFSSEGGWKIIDDTMQARGGRGYETGESLAQRELTTAVDRIFRDSRPNRIFEGSTQILTQWTVREGLDEYLKKGAPFFRKGMRLEKLKAAARFGWQYVRSFFSNFTVPRIDPDNLSVVSSHLDFIDHGVPAIYSNDPAVLTKHLKFVDYSSRRLARAIIWLSAKYRDKMSVKQLTLARLYTIASELYAVTAVCSYAIYLGYEWYVDLADLFCREAVSRVNDAFRDLWDNNDSLARKIAKKVLNKEYPQLEKGAATVEDIFMKNF